MGQRPHLVAKIIFWEWPFASPKEGPEPMGRVRQKGEPMGQRAGFGGCPPLKQKERADLGRARKEPQPMGQRPVLGALGCQKASQKRRFRPSLFGAEIHPKRNPPGLVFSGQKPVLPVQQQL